MKLKILFTTVFLALAVPTAFAGGHLSELAKAAISLDSAVAEAAIKSLREQGQKGSDVLFSTYSSEISQAGDNRKPQNWDRIAYALDKVTMQKDSYASSRIFWYTDLEKAKELSRRTKRPILSLRLLGNLNEEYSCANSRLFRALLYPDAFNQTWLHDKYILHWKTVRPAPKVTVDFGNGHKIVRTLTGNSIHYVLGSDGKVIDALPGLYSSQEFRKFLGQAKQVFDIGRKMSLKNRGSYYIGYQESSFRELIAKRERNLRVANIAFAEEAKSKTKIPTARNAAPVAVTKMVITAENLLVDQITDNFSKFEPMLNLKDWKRLAELRVGKVYLPMNSKRFIWRQLKLSGATMSHHSRRIKKLEDFIALDTVRNEYLYRPAIYELLSKNSKLSADQINDKIYDKVFLTPNSDPWLGLNAPDIYTGLNANGVVN